MALFGALADGTTRLTNFSSAADCHTTLACLQALGVPIEVGGDAVTIEARGPEAWRSAPEVLDCGNSGSTLRMLSGALAGRPFRSVLTGDMSLRKRPMRRLAAPLARMGARVEMAEGDRPPLTIEGGRLAAIDWSLDVPSAQVKTAVLLAGLQAEGRTAVSTPLLCRDHTERLLPLFGVEPERNGLETAVAGPTTLRGSEYEIPGDASGAAFLVLAGLLTGEGEVRIENVLLNPTRSAYLNVFKRMGANIEVRKERDEPEPTGVIEIRPSFLKGTEIGPDEVPLLADEVPALAVAAALAEGETRLYGARELRVKESDRLAALADSLGRMGADIEETPDGLVIRGRERLTGAAVSSHGDHRIAMALAVAALAADGATEIDDAECAAVSFPEFFDLIERGRA